MPDKEDLSESVYSVSDEEDVARKFLLSSAAAELKDDKSIEQEDITEKTTFFGNHVLDKKVLRKLA